jgi:hypothetical protein
MPTEVTPMGHAALPIDSRMYWSPALVYSRFLQCCTIRNIFSRMSASMSFFLSFENRGFR